MQLLDIDSIKYRLRNALCEISSQVEERKMFKGTCFMVDGKMCICVSGNQLLCRIGYEKALAEINKDNCRQMIHNGRVMKDFVFVVIPSIVILKSLDYWIGLRIQFIENK